MEDRFGSASAAAVFRIGTSYTSADQHISHISTSIAAASAGQYISHISTSIVPLLQENVSLKPYNTFGMDVRARYFAAFRSVAALQDLLRDPVVRGSEKLILGGGSNLLLRGDFDGVVLKNEIEELTFQVDATTDLVRVRAGAGLSWHALVERTLAEHLGGLENLSLIPGTVGAAPLQNIGAYGVELKDSFEELEAVALATGEVRRFSAEECRFGYRESVFKNELKGQYVVVYVTLRLRRHPTEFRTDYGDIQTTLREMAVAPDQLAAHHVSEAVQRIRRAKLPDPAQIGNAGSFFKNPEISRTQYEQLKQQHPEMPGYLLSGGERVKVPAGWLIERAGWKGHRRGAGAGTHGVHDRQALVLVNHGGASGAEVWALAQDVIASVLEQYGIALTPEVNVL